MWDRPIKKPEDDEVCFYNNTLFRRNSQELKFQAKIYDQSSDYFSYVWYSNERDPKADKLSNIVGSFQLNGTGPQYLQDGFSVSDEMTFYIVIIRNATINKEDLVRNSFTGV